MTADLTGRHIILRSRILGDLTTPSPHYRITADDILTYAIHNSILNMFSFIPRSTRLARKRIFGPVYSHSSSHSPRVQHILKTRTAKLSRFLSNQVTVSPTGISGHLIPRNFLRPLGADIFNAFAFSDAEGRAFWIDCKRALTPWRNSVWISGSSGTRISAIHSSFSRVNPNSKDSPISLRPMDETSMCDLRLGLCLS